MGGLVSLYALFKHPRVFGAAGAMSPALWYGERRIFDAIGDVRSGASRSANPQRIYLDMGTEEGSVALRDARAMADRLERAGYRAGQTLLWVEEIRGAAHRAGLVAAAGTRDPLSSPGYRSGTRLTTLSPDLPADR